MKKFTGVLWLRTNTFLVILTAAALSVVDLCSSAQAQDVNVRSEVFHDGILARGVRHELTVPNVLKEVPIMLDSVQISVSNRKDLTWAEPNWELLPFLDYLVIKVRNDGWEDFQARELDAFAVPGQFAPGEVDNWDPLSDVERVRNILEKKSGPILIKEPVVDYRFLFMKLAPDAEPFGFVYERADATRGIPRLPAFLNMDNPHDAKLGVIRGERKIGEPMPAPKGEPIPAPKKKMPKGTPEAPNKELPDFETELSEKPVPKGQAADTDGHAILFGSMTPKGGGRIEHYFQTTVLQLGRHIERELYTSELCGASLHGGVAPSGVFLFGNEPMAFKQAAMIERIYGITVDLRGTTGDYVREFPVNRMIGPNADDPKVGPMTFDLRFLTDRPSEFTVYPAIKWHAGKNEPVTLDKKKFEIRIIFPRVHDYSWLTTRHFVSHLLDADPGALNRCRKIIDTDVVAPKRDTLAGWAMIERIYVDALLVLSVKGDPSDTARLTKCCRRLFSSIDGKDKASVARKRIALNALSILCYFDREGAAKLVRHCLLAKHEAKKEFNYGFADPMTLLALAMSCDPILHSLLKDSSGLEAIVEGHVRNYYWSPAAFLLACHTGMPVVEKLLNDKEVVDKELLLSCLALTACTTPNKHAKPFLIGMVRKQLGDKNLDLGCASAILRSLQSGGSAEFRGHVRVFLQNCPRGMAAADVLYASLRYLEAIGTTSEDEPLLRELSGYFYRSEVRDIAKKLLKSGSSSTP